MHSYSTDTSRGKIAGILIVIAISATLTFNWLIQITHISIPWYIDTPAVSGFYGLLLAIFDQYLWKLKIGNIKCSKIPDISGTWIGKIKYEYNGSLDEKVVVVWIKQTWLKFSLQLRTDTSISRTTMAAFNMDTESSSTLQYVYYNKGRTYDKKQFYFDGTGNLDLPIDNKYLEGKYYTSKDNSKTGTIYLHFLVRKTLTDEEAREKGKKMQYI